MFKLSSTVTYSTDGLLILSNYVLQPTPSAHFCSPYAILKEKVATDYRERSKRHHIETRRHPSEASPVHTSKPVSQEKA